MQQELYYANSDNSFFISHVEKTGFSTMLRRHLHDKFEIYYLLSGERYYFIKDRTYHVIEGDLVFIDAHDLHKTIDASVPDHKRIVINFNDKFVSTSNNSIDAILHLLFRNNANVMRLNSNEQNIVEGILSKIIYEASNKAFGYEASIQSLLTQLLVFASRHAKVNINMLFEHPSHTHKKVAEIVQYINRNYMNKIDLSTISEKFFISRYHFSRIFKEATGFTFTEYINSVRIQEAQKYLRETNWKIAAISEKTGFESIAHFGRVFKKATGLSPLNYKKKIT